MINNKSSTGNRGVSLLSIKAIFPTEKTYQTSDGKLVKHDIMFNFQTSLAGQGQLNNGFK